MRETMKTKVNVQHFIGGSDGRLVMGDLGAAVRRLWRHIRPEAKRGELPLDVTTKALNRRWYRAITGRVPIGWHLAAVCCATATMLLGWWPWNFLLLLLLFSIRNKRARFCVFPATQSNGPVPPKVSYTRGSSL
jgi:hypothetical protein